MKKFVIICIAVCLLFAAYESRIELPPVDNTTPAEELITRFTSTQSAAPKAVGKAAARTAQRMPPLSFFIVRSVVEHGQCSSEKIITHAAVACVQPFAASTPRSEASHTYGKLKGGNSFIKKNLPEIAKGIAEWWVNYELY